MFSSLKTVTATPRGLACGTSSSSFILGLAVGGRVVFPPLQSVLSPAGGPHVWGHSRFSPAAFGPRAGHLSVQHFTLHQPGQGRQGLSFVAEGAAAHDSVRLHISVWGISPPPRRGSTNGSKQRLQGFCSTAVAFLPPTERSDRGNTAVGHRTRVLQPKGDGGLRPILDLQRFNFPSTKGSSRCG